MIPSVDIIGTPFAYRGRGPETFDCYGCCMFLSARWGRPIPDYDYPEVKDLGGAGKVIQEKLATDKRWRPCEIKVGAILHFKVLDVPSHVGIVVNKYDFVHCWEHTGGVTREKLHEWVKPHRLLGVYEYA